MMGLLCFGGDKRRFQLFVFRKICMDDPLHQSAYFESTYLSMHIIQERGGRVVADP